MRVGLLGTPSFRVLCERVGSTDLVFLFQDSIPKDTGPMFPPLQRTQEPALSEVEGMGPSVVVISDKKGRATRQKRTLCRSTKIEVKKGEKPSGWKQVRVADSGGDEEFTKQMLELCSILEAGFIQGSQRAAAKHAIISTLMDGLMPAFLELEQIQSTNGKPIPLMNREQMFGDFARKLWKSYKELMQQTAQLIGFDIGFLFMNDKEFRKGLIKLRTEHPTIRNWFEKFLEQTRDNWQNDLCKFRNTWVEHQRGERRNFDRFYKPEYAEAVFTDAWNTIVTILAAMLETHLPFGIKLIEQHENDPGQKWPNRFQYRHPMFRGMK